MPGHSPLQIGTPLDVSNGLRTSLMSLQQEQTAVHSTSGQNHRADIYRVIQDQLLAISHEKHGLLIRDRCGFPKCSFEYALKAQAHFRTLTATRLASSASFRSLVSAIEDFNEGVTRGQRDLLIDKQTSFQVLLQAAQEDLKKRFSAKTPQSKKTQIWRNIKSGLERFCQAVYNYSSVMDVLVSSHPEIASLAWGAMKFLLAVSINHQELKEKIVYHLGEIGEHFKIIDSYVRLFPEMDMVKHVCGVYEHFNVFLQLSISWCKENALVKFFKNVALPYEARIKPTIDELNKYMRRVKDRVEIHNTHRLAVMQYDITALIGILDDSRRLQVDSHSVIAQLLQGIALDQKKQANQPFELAPSVTYPEMKDSMSNTGSLPKEQPNTSFNPFPDPLLTSQHLQDCAIQSIQLEVNQSYIALDLPNKPEIKAWTSSNDSALLWIDGFANSYASKWTTEFSIDVLFGAERQRSIVLFYFGDVVSGDTSGSSSDYFASPKAIIHSFIIQLLRQNSYLAEEQAEWLTPQRWIEAHRSTKAAWNLLHYLLESLSPEGRIIYLIIDSIDALSNVNNRSCDLRSFLRRLSALVTLSTRGETTGSNITLPIKILLTSVTSSVHPLLFPPAAAGSLPSHSIVHIPQTFGQHNVPQAPVHLRQPSAKRLVRLPNSDDEFGLKPADSFGFSDDEQGDDLLFSSDDENACTDRRSINQREGKMQVEIGVQNRMAQHSVCTVNKTTARRESGSSEELDFSENEADNALKAKQLTDDIQFSSSEEEM